jgi:hypothetical protein
MRARGLHVSWPELAAARLPFTRRYRFRESPLPPEPGLVVLATPDPTVPDAWLRGDDLLVLFHPETPDEQLGRVVNRLRDHGHEVEVVRTPASRVDGRRPRGLPCGG